ncbi:hypothetical protein T12_15532 [Trichinella patagoniensis]|uniref:Uncharacterized protein n=1 Tax=Trichinella patagoniensis TaxID=990121 RepID=A0A0V0ZTE4_9BILA|nr:hypothetical protein T12_15532 [Trichinella patagoniensis]
MNSYICLNVFLITALVVFSVIEKFSFAENTTESPKRKASASITVPVSIGSACSLCVLIGICCCVCICRRKCRRRNKTKQTVNVNVNTNTVTNAATTAMQPTMPMMAPYAYPPVMPAYQPPTYPPPVGQSNFPNPAPPAYSSAVNAGKATTDPGQPSADGKTTELASQVKADGSQKNPDSIFQKCVVFFKEINANVFRHIGQHAAERANDSLQLFRFTVIYFFLLIYSISKILVHFVQRSLNKNLKLLH